MLARLPEDIEREIVTAYCGLACLLPEALGRRNAYTACLAELDYVRHNVQTGTSITQRTLREWAERPVAKKPDVLMWRLEQWHRQRTRPPPGNYAAFRALSTVPLLVAFLILQNALSRC